MDQLPRHLFALFPRKIVCQDATKIIEPKLDDTQCGFCRGRSTKEKISTLQQIFKNSWDDAKDHTRVLSILGKCMAGFFMKSFGGCYGSTVLTGASCWPSSSIPDQKIVSASEVKSQLFSFVVRLRQWCVLPPLLCLYQGPLHNSSRAKSDL